MMPPHSHYFLPFLPRTQRTMDTRLSESRSQLSHIMERGKGELRWRRMAGGVLLALTVTLCSAVALLVLSSVIMRVQPPPSVPTLQVQSLHSRRRLRNKDCLDGKYTTTTLQRAYELPFAALFQDNKGQQKFEASSVIVVNDDAYAVCDSSWAISKFGKSLVPFSPANVQIGNPNREKEEEEESNYEAIFHDNDIFYVVRESIDLAEPGRRKAQSYHAVIEELSLSGDDYEVIAECPCEFEFQGTKKGFEGAEAIRDLNNELVVLGLCEGNYCSEDYVNDTGNGRVIAMKKVVEDDGSCSWSTIREIELPPSADFQDYSDISVDVNGRVAITSQEDSAVWIGKMVGQNNDGLWDIDKLEFNDDDFKVYDFPRNDECKKVYCNIEGIHWMGGNMLMAVSDKMKNKGRQHFRCFEKDQSVHTFLIPP